MKLVLFNSRFFDKFLARSIMLSVGGSLSRGSCGRGSLLRGLPLARFLLLLLFLSNLRVGDLLAITGAGVGTAPGLVARGRRRRRRDVASGFATDVTVDEIGRSGLTAGVAGRVGPTTI